MVAEDEQRGLARWYVCFRSEQYIRSLDRSLREVSELGRPPTAQKLFTDLAWDLEREATGVSEATIDPSLYAAAPEKK